MRNVMPVSFPELPEEVLVKVLQCLPFGELALACISLQLTSKPTASCFHPNSSVWTSLLPDAGALTCPATRRSARTVPTSARQVFIRGWRVLITRAEMLHHAVAVSGQDASNMSASTLKAHLKRYGPDLLLDRVSPVYNATMLMEVCRARGVREESLVGASELLICGHGADPNARASDCGCTPLIIAACRGLYKLAAFLLACGADLAPRGHGRFRLCGRAQSLAGTHTALEWTRQLLAEEEKAGIPEASRRSLIITARLLESEAAKDMRLSRQADGLHHVLSIGVGVATHVGQQRREQARKMLERITRPSLSVAVGGYCTVVR
jgi:hypothetical protein